MSWGIFWGTLPAFRMKTLTKNSETPNNILTLSIERSTPYSFVHFYRNISISNIPQEQKLELMFLIPGNTGDKNISSRIQAIEWKISIWIDEKRYEWALQYQNQQDKKPSWNYWHPHKGWLSLNITKKLEENLWYDLMLNGKIQKDFIIFNNILLDGRNYPLNIKIPSSISRDTPNYAAIAIQLISNSKSDPYSILIDKVNINFNE